MDGVVKKYSNGEITVIWDSKKCIHSAKCINGLPQVFNVYSSPWINIKGADSDAIIAQVGKCPSGALSIEQKDPVMEENAEIQVEVLKNGPLMVSGTIKVKDKDGSECMKEKATFFCRCGQSQNKPYCDGTHKKVGFEG